MKGNFSGLELGLSAHLRRTQRRVDSAKKRADALGMDQETTLISDDEMEDNDNKEDEELPRDENAQKIQ